jgi:hypothetical protein
MGIILLKPTGHLLRGPFLLKLGSDNVAQAPMQSQ